MFDSIAACFADVSQQSMTIKVASILRYVQYTD
jgi:hypothetical protein